MCEFKRKKKNQGHRNFDQFPSIEIETDPNRSDIPTVDVDSTKTPGGRGEGWQGTGGGVS